MSSARRWMTGLFVAAAGAALALWALNAGPHWADAHLLPSYCPTGAATWALARGARWLAFAAGLAAIALAPWAAARGAAIPVRRPSAGGALRVGLAVAASLLATELVLHRLHDRLTLGPAGPAGPAGARLAMALPDPRLGWVDRPGRVTVTEVAGRRVAYAIDVEGNRASAPDDQRDPLRPTVVFTGESIAFGYGLEFAETFPALVERDLGVQAVNAAVIGYGNDQAYLRALDVLARYRRPLAVVTLFHPGQIRRNVDPWRPRLALASAGALTLVPPSRGPRLARLLGALPARGDAALEVTAAILRESAAAARARGAFPLFVVTNYGPACLPEASASGQPWIVEELFVRQGLPFVRVDLGPGDLLPGAFEGHPNARGARKIADAVERELSGRLAPYRAARDAD